MKNNKMRILIWIILLVLTLGFGTTGLLLSGDLRSINFFKNFYKIENKIDLNYIATKLNAYLNDYYTNTDIVASASVSENIITVSINDDIIETNYNYILNDDILSCEFSTEKSVIGIDLFNIIISFVEEKYFDVIQNDTINTLENDEAKTFTLETDNYELSESSNKIIGKLNVNKQITILDFNTDYIKISDLTEETTLIKENDTYQKSINNLVLQKIDNGNNIIISIFEKDLLTENTYKSLISFLTILYDEVEADSFKEQYPGITEDFTFDKYIIAVNPEPTESENTFMTDGYKLLRVTISK